MNDAEFIVELHKYPLVRSRSWKGSQHAATSGGTKLPAGASVAVRRHARHDARAELDNIAWLFPQKTAAPEPTHFKGVPFWDALAIFLNRHYNSELASAILQTFKESYADSLQRLSLDGMPFLCVFKGHRSASSDRVALI